MSKGHLQNAVSGGRKEKDDHRCELFLRFAEAIEPSGKC
nr:hypothetical protein Iba_chr15aCG9180 [Ipomoea batatas]